MSGPVAARIDEGPLSPLRHPRFRGLWLAGLVSFLGTWVHNVAARWTAATLSPSPAVVSWVDTLQLLPMVLLSIAAGRFADRHDRRRVLLVTHVGLAAVALAMGVAAVGWGAPVSTADDPRVGWIDVRLLLGMTAAMGCFSAVNGPAWQATVPRQVPDAEVPRAVALMSTGFNLARAVGPAVGAWMLVRGGAAGAFVANALSYLVIGYLFWRMPPQPPARAFALPVEASPLADPGLRRLYAIVLGFCVCAQPALSLLPVVARDSLGGEAADYGWLLSAFGAGAVAAGLLVARGAARFGRLSFVAGACGLAALGLAGLGWTATLGEGLVASALCGAGWIGAIATVNAGVQLSAPSESRAQSLAYYLTFAVGGQSAGSFVGGLLAEQVGLRAAFGVDAVGVAVLGAVVFLVGR